MAARSVFLSSPARTDTSVIRRVLVGEGVNVLESEDLEETGQLIRESLIEGMQKADAVIVVLGHRPGNENVYYEMGLADAMRKPVLIVSGGALDPASDVALYPYIRARHDDEEALRFGVSHFLRAPHSGTKPSRDYTSTTKPLGELVDGFLTRLRSDLVIREDELVGLIATAIRESGVDTQASDSHRSSGEEIPADIAVWSDDLASLIGNPLPIEVRSSLLTAQDAERAAKNLMRAIIGAQVRWGLILFTKATSDAVRTLSKYPVLAMSIEDFLEGLRERSFSRIVIDLRNRAVHGVRPDA
jgi:hypothetical protein